MRIAFISGNREQLPDPVVPIGVLYVMAAVAAHHQCELVDLCFESAPYDHARTRLADYRPDVVAIGMRNIQNHNYTGISDTLGHYQALVAAVREGTDAPIVMGGGGFSVMPRALMERLGADYGICGEGERSLELLLDSLEHGRPDLSRIPGLYYRRDDGVVEASSAPVVRHLDLNGLPDPLLRLADPRYYAETGTEPIQTKRGCALECTYCTYPLIEGHTIRCKDPSQVVDNLFHRLEANPDIRHVFVVDSVFNLPPRHAKALCRELIRRRFPIPWTCYANPIAFDSELAGLMREAGCQGMEVGSDSGCDHVLRSLNKGFDTARIRKLHETSAAAGLKDCHTFMLGTPAETLDDVHRSLDFIVDMKPHCAILMAYKDDAESLDDGYAQQRADFRRQVLDVMDQRRADYPRWIVPDLGVNHDLRLFKALRRQGIAGPLWQQM